MDEKSRVGKVQTVAGLVEPSQLGHTQTHEHLINDASFMLEHADISALAPHRRAHIAEPISLQNIHWIREHRLNASNFDMSDIRLAIEETQEYRARGGGTLVEVTSIGLGRSPSALRRISEASGVNIVMGTGHYTYPTHSEKVQASSVSELADVIIEDCLVGADGTSIKSGVIGEVGMSTPFYPSEIRALHAAAIGQQHTGVPIVVHPGAGEDYCLEIVRIIEESGGDPTRTVIGHLDFMPSIGLGPRRAGARRDRERFDSVLGSLIAIAQTGCYICFDCFGNNHNHSIDIPTDIRRLDFLAELVERGYAEQLLISQDVWQRVRLGSYGGEGYTYILETIVPLMVEFGFDSWSIETILRRNPSRLLAIV